MTEEAWWGPEQAALKEAARLLRCSPDRVPAAVAALLEKVGTLRLQVLSLADPGPISLETAARHGIERVRHQRWANKLDHFELTIIDGKPGAWVRMWAPVNAMFGDEKPDGFQINALGVGTPSVSPTKPLFLPYTGPLPDSDEYRAEVARFATAGRGG